MPLSPFPEFYVLLRKTIPTSMIQKCSLVIFLLFLWLKVLSLIDFEFIFWYSVRQESDSFSQMGKKVTLPFIE